MATESESESCSTTTSEEMELLPLAGAKSKVWNCFVEYVRMIKFMYY